MDQSKIWIVIPTYCEEENIKEITDSIFAHAPEVNVLVADDNSPDDTQDIVNKLKKSNPKLHLLVRKADKGYAKSLIDGFKHAIAQGAEYVFQMDADMSHHPKYLPKLINKLEQATVVCGSRWMQGGGTQNWPTHRVFLSRGATMYVKTLLGFKLHDCTAGWIGYKKDILEKIGLNTIKSDGYGFNVEIKYRAKTATCALANFLYS